MLGGREEEVGGGAGRGREQVAGGNSIVGMAGSEVLWGTRGV